jgi:hypothetical protein
LFDDRDMAEITSPDYPGERLVVCRNPLLAAERARKRDELLAATEAELARIRARVQRSRNPLRGAAAIGQALGAVFGRRKVAKHFDTTITDDTFSFSRNQAAIAAEAALDGIYVVRTNLPPAQCDAAISNGTCAAVWRPCCSMSMIRPDATRSAPRRWPRPGHRRQHAARPPSGKPTRLMASRCRCTVSARCSPISQR